MTVISQPDISLAIVPARTEVSNTPQRVLFVGQKLSSGTAQSGVLIENILNDNSWDTMFGAKSMLAGMLRSARLINQVSQFDVIALDDPGSSNEAEATVTFTGTATASGTITVSVGSRRDHAYQLSISSGDTAANVASALHALITADTRVPVDSAVSSGVVSLTASQAGTEGNVTGLAFEGSVAGLTTAIAAFTGGSGVPTLTNLFDVIRNRRYQTIVWPDSYGVDTVRTLLDARFNVNNKILDGVAVMTKVDSHANLLAAGNALNSQSIVIKGQALENEINWRGPDILEVPTKTSAMLGAVRALRLTQDASISRFVVGSGGARDVFGGPAIASLPYFNTPLPELRVSPPNLGFSDLEIEQLTAAGITVCGSNTAGNGVILGEVVTTYKTDAAGNPDVSFKYLNYVDTSSQAREFMWNNMKADFAQSRLTNGDVLPNRNMHNVNTIRARIVSYYVTLSGNDYVLLQAGPVARDFFIRNLSVEIDLAQGRVQVDMKSPLVTQFRTLVGTFQLAFDIE